MKPKKASSKAASEAVAVNRRRLLNNASPFAIKEAYVKLRTSLMFCMTADKERACKTFAITSSKPSEGKSLTAANVAISYAMLGKKVLLIDADMRKPTQKKLWKVELAAGLYVIIDTPPINTVADAQIVATYVDGVVLVTKSGYTTSDELNAAIEAVHQAGGNLCGVVLNGLNMKSVKYSYKYKYSDKYGYKYGYRYGDKYAYSDANETH